MGWKNWPYWLRGGISLDLLIIISMIIFPKLSEIPIISILLYFPLFYGFIIGGLIILFCWFIIGAIIGWIYGKIKRESNNE